MAAGLAGIVQVPVIPLNIPVIIFPFIFPVTDKLPFQDHPLLLPSEHLKDEPVRTHVIKFVLSVYVPLKKFVIGGIAFGIIVGLVVGVIEG